MGNERFRFDRQVSIIIITALCTACSAPKLYSNDIRIDYGGPQRPAAIQVSDPKLFPRHALINERRDEELYLKDQLDKSASATFAPQILREIENVRALSAAVGISFDASVRDQARATTATNDIAQQIALESLRGSLAQVQRDVELLKDKLSAQTAPSATSADVKQSSVSGVTMPELASNKDMITALGAQIVALQKSLDQATTGPRESLASGSPEELFEDRQAFRQKIEAAIHANSLDALHDIGTNSLFRLQFKAIALPEARTGMVADASTPQLGLLEMSLKRPAIAEQNLQRELKGLYFQWLDYVTANLNAGWDGGNGLIDGSLYQLGLEQRAMTIVDINTGRPDKAAQANAAASDAKTPTTKTKTKTKNQETAGAAVAHVGSGNVVFYTIKQPGTFVPPGVAQTRKNAKQVFELGIAKDSAAKAAGTSTGQLTPCKFGLVVPAHRALYKDCELLHVAYPPRFDTEKLLEMQGDVKKLPVEGLRSAVEIFEQEAWSAHDTAQIAARCTSAETRFQVYKYLFTNRLALRRLQRTYSGAALLAGQRDPRLDASFADVIDAVGSRMVLAERAFAIAAKLGCQGGIWDEGAEDAPVPQRFIEALFIKPSGEETTWRARGRLSVYAVTPTALVQRVSTAARAADAIQMAASLAASVPVKGLGASAGLGYMRSVTGKLDAIERVPLVVAYATGAQYDSDSVERKETHEARFGWLLGPKVVINSEKEALALEHSLTSYDLSADISMPGWWPRLDIETNSAWGPKWDIANGRLLTEPVKFSHAQPTTVPMRHTAADMGGITTLLLDSTQNDGEGGGAGLRLPTAWISDIMPSSVSDCATSTTFVVKGRSLWRASTAFLSGVESSQVAVMPDMGGITVTVDISKLQPGAGDAQLVVPTPDGEGTAVIHVQGNRGVAAACSVKEADDGTPHIASVLPETVYACDRAQKLIVNGSNLSAFKSGTLGSLDVTFGYLSDDGKLMELTLPGPIGKSGGSLTKLPLVLHMATGDAIASVGVERADCSGAGAGKLTLVSGAIDVCTGASTTTVIGKGAGSLVGARLVSTLPKFELRAKSVRFNAVTKTSDAEFVGIPKGVAGPDGVGSSITLMLTPATGKEVAIEAPMVCSAYSAK